MPSLQAKNQPIKREIPDVKKLMAIIEARFDERALDSVESLEFYIKNALRLETNDSLFRYDEKNILAIKPDLNELSPEEREICQHSAEVFNLRFIVGALKDDLEAEEFHTKKAFRRRFDDRVGMIMEHSLTNLTKKTGYLDKLWDKVEKNWYVVMGHHTPTGPQSTDSNKGEAVASSPLKRQNAFKYTPTDNNAKPASEESTNTSKIEENVPPRASKESLDSEIPPPPDGSVPPRPPKQYEYQNDEGVDVKVTLSHSPHQILGLKANVTDQKEIYQAYKTLAKELHPDKNMGNENAKAAFQELGSAYQYLLAQL